jgi:uncharacterized protein GlcG (DUF336 family)
MTKPLPFTESILRRAIAAVQKAGLRITATRVTPDGAVTIFHDDDAAAPPASKRDQDKWLDVEA